MINLKRTIKTVEDLLAAGTAKSATYAALECRLAIERVCYERLRIAHDYISHDDLRRWQPRGVVDTLIAEVDDHTASTVTLSVSSEPVTSSGASPKEPTEWVPLGTQVGFDPKKLGGLWHALSNVALHTRLPKTKDENIPDYGDVKEITKKAEDALAELKRLAEGTLISTGIGKEVSFDCECGKKNKRRVTPLAGGKVISCIDPDCLESYAVRFEGDDIYFERCVLSPKCACGETLAVRTREAMRLSRNEQLRIDCPSCGGHVLLAWRVQMRTIASDKGPASDQETPSGA